MLGMALIYFTQFNSWISSWGGSTIIPIFPLRVSQLYWLALSRAVSHPKISQISGMCSLPCTLCHHCDSRLDYSNSVAFLSILNSSQCGSSADGEAFGFHFHTVVHSVPFIWRMDPTPLLGIGQTPRSVVICPHDTSCPPFITINIYAFNTRLYRLPGEGSVSVSLGPQYLVYERRSLNVLFPGKRLESLS